MSVESMQGAAKGRWQVVSLSRGVAVFAQWLERVGLKTGGAEMDMPGRKSQGQSLFTVYTVRDANSKLISGANQAPISHSVNPRVASKLGDIAVSAQRAMLSLKPPPSK